MNNMYLHASNTSNGGYVVILNTLVFLAISLFVIYAVVAPLISANQATAELDSSKKAFIVANSAAEETLYKMKNQMNVNSNESLTLAGTTADIEVSNTFDGKLVQVVGRENDAVRNIRASVSESVGVSFNYGVQSGRGGFNISGGSGINGNVYANGPVLGTGGAWITGSATAANGADPKKDQSSTGPMPPPYDLTFGGNATPSQDVAQSFTVGTSTPVTSVRVYVKRTTDTWMSDVTVRLVRDKNGAPGNNTIATTHIFHEVVTTSYNHLTLPFDSAPELEPGERYWLVFDTGTSWDGYYSFGANEDAYADGQAQIGSWHSNGGSWGAPSPSDLDMYFDFYVGGEEGLISGMEIGENGGDAWAHQVRDSSVAGTIYCQSAANNNKACDTSRPSPVQQPFPISDGNIEAWKDEAEGGGTESGNLVVGPWPNQEVSLGPQKIDGDLSVNSGGTLTVTGTLWVTGDITVNGGGVIRLDDSYGDTAGIIVSDGEITATGGGNFEDNGVAGNYILVVTTSECPDASGCGGPAILVSGGAGAVILNAQKGTLEFSGGAEAKQATAETIIMSGGTEVNYETGLADMNFESGPSGSWSIDEWNEN